ncbi:putative Acid phosphatase [Helianthus annuus]|nr:putative Acid phosphatase [Helianthus annuus]
MKKNHSSMCMYVCMYVCINYGVNHTGNVELFFVDTTPFQDKYFTETDHQYDWRGVLPREEYMSRLLKDVDLALKESSSKWKIVVGHHTIFSAGHHGNTQELVDKLLPILLLQFLTSGGGSKAWKGDINPWNLDEMKFYYDGQGFIAAEITENDIYVSFYDIFGNILHKWSGSGDMTYSTL